MRDHIFSHMSNFSTKWYGANSTIHHMNRPSERLLQLPKPQLFICAVQHHSLISCFQFPKTAVIRPRASVYPTNKKRWNKTYVGPTDTSSLCITPLLFQPRVIGHSEASLFSRQCFFLDLTTGQVWRLRPSGRKQGQLTETFPK